MIDKIPVTEICDVSVVSGKVASGWLEFHVDWSLLKRCNYDCIYCWDDTHDNTSEIPDADVLVENASKICEYADTLGDISMKTVTISGGEPMLVRGISKVLQVFKDAGFFVTLLSNGSARSERYNRLATIVDYMKFSWHMGNDSDEMKQMLLDVKAVIPNYVVFILTNPEHVDETADAIEFCRTNDITYMYIDVLLGTDMEVWSMPDGFKEKYHNEQGSGNDGFEMRVTDSLGRTKRTRSSVMYKNETNVFTGWECSVSGRCLRIRYNGDIHDTMCLNNKPVGNLYTDDKIVMSPRTVTCTVPRCACEVDLVTFDGVSKKSS